MKHIFKIVSYVVITLLTFAITGNSFAAATPFSDIAGIPSKDKITALQEKGCIDGLGNGVFAPEKNVTAAQGVQFIVKALGMNIDTIRFFKKPEATDYFLKAENNAWYANSMIIAAANGLELPKDINPNRNLTQEEFTFYLTEAMETQGKLPLIKIIPPQIADQEKISSNYIGAIQRAIVYKITQVDARGNFNPQKNITRADAAEQVYNAAAYLKAHALGASVN